MNRLEGYRPDRQPSGGGHQKSPVFRPQAPTFLPFFAVPPRKLNNSSRFQGHTAVKLYGKKKETPLGVHLRLW